MMKRIVFVALACVAFYLWVLMPRPALAESVVQTCSAAPGTQTTTQSITCTVSQNQLVVVVAYIAHTGLTTSVSGGVGSWTKVDSNTCNSSNQMDTWEHIAGAADGGSYTISWGSTSYYSHIDAWVVDSANTTTPIDTFNHVCVTGASTATTPSVTPGGGRTDLPLAAFANNNNHATPTFTTGWTQDFNGTNGALYLEAQHGPDASAATTATITYTTSPVSGILGEIILVEPAPPSAALTNGLAATGAGGPHQSIVVSGTGGGGSLPPQPRTMSWFDEFGNNQNITAADADRLLDICVGGDYGNGTTTAQLFTDCNEQFEYAIFPDGDAKDTDGHSVSLPWHVSLTQATGKSTCPATSTSSTGFFSGSAPDYTSTGSNNWFVYTSSIGSASTRVMAANEFSSPATYIFFLNMNSTTLQSYVKSVLDGCVYHSDTLDNYTGWFSDNASISPQSTGWTPYGGEGLTNFKNIDGSTSSPSGQYALGSCNGGNRSLFTGTFCTTTTQLSSSASSTATYPLDGDYQAAFENFYPTLTHNDNTTPFKIIYNGLISDYQSKNINQVSNIEAGTNEHAVTKNGSSSGVPQPDIQMWEVLDTCSGNASFSPNVYMFDLDDGLSATGSRSPFGSAAFQQDLRIHYGMQWACRPDANPLMMGSWLNYCGDEASTYNCVDIWAADFSTPDSRIGGYQGPATDGSGNPCGENFGHFYSANVGCTQGGVRDPSIEATGTCGTINTSQAPCLFVFKWSHYWVWNLTACPSYDRTNWNTTCVKDVGPFVALANFDNGAGSFTLSSTNLQTWLGASLYNQLKFVLAFCTPTSGYFGTSGNPIYATGTTSVCSGTSSSDADNGGVLDLSTSISSILGTTLPDGEWVFLSASH